LAKGRVWRKMEEERVCKEAIMLEKVGNEGKKRKIKKKENRTFI
jgi:hypothetical protein